MHASVKRGRVFLLSGFNARVGKSDDVDNVIGMSGETTCNSYGNLLIQLLQNWYLMICNGRTWLSDPQWTQVQNCFYHKSIIDHIIIDKGLMKELRDTFVDKTNKGSSDHYLVWFELGRNFSRSRNKAKHIL